jgi:hypothetical protein
MPLEKGQSPSEGEPRVILGPIWVAAVVVVFGLQIAAAFARRMHASPAACRLLAICSIGCLGEVILFYRLGSSRFAAATRKPLLQLMALCAFSTALASMFSYPPIHVVDAVIPSLLAAAGCASVILAAVPLVRPWPWPVAVAIVGCAWAFGSVVFLNGAFDGGAQDRAVYRVLNVASRLSLRMRLREHVDFKDNDGEIQTLDVGRDYGLVRANVGDEVEQVTGRGVLGITWNVSTQLTGRSLEARPLPIQSPPDLPPDPGLPRVPSEGDFVAYVPKGFSGRSPLVIGLTPTGSGQDLVGLWKEACDKYGWVLVAYNHAPAEDLSDEPLILGLVDMAVDRFPADRSRVYLSGFSAGAMLAYILVFHRPELFRGVVANTGVMNRAFQRPGIDFPAEKEAVLLASPSDFRYGDMQDDRQFLEKHRWRVMWFEFDGGHAFATPGLYTKAANAIATWESPDPVRTPDGRAPSSLKR